MTKAWADTRYRTKAIDHGDRLGIDDETHPHRSEAIIHIAMIDLISRRLTRQTTPNWRDT